MISCLLMRRYSQKFHLTAEDCLRFFAERRTNNGKGVTIESQKRYVRYYSLFLNSSFKMNEGVFLLKTIQIFFLPNWIEVKNMECKVQCRKEPPLHFPNSPNSSNSLNPSNSPKSFNSALNFFSSLSTNTLPTNSLPTNSLPTNSPPTNSLPTNSLSTVEQQKSLPKTLTQQPKQHREEREEEEEEWEEKETIYDKKKKKQNLINGKETVLNNFSISKHTDDYFDVELRPTVIVYEDFRLDFGLFSCWLNTKFISKIGENYFVFINVKELDGLKKTISKYPSKMYIKLEFSRL